MTTTTRNEHEHQPAIEVCIRVNGIVQGVGFRPAVWRLARARDITGTVNNDTAGVFIRACGSRVNIDAFIEDLTAAPPLLARIDSIHCDYKPVSETFDDFRILDSLDGQAHTAVNPDAASCEDCINDIRNPNNRRFRYPLTNCTHCGPRFSIIHGIPYDRENTSMRPFTLCQACAKEYRSPADRRFHAQPNACHECGPQVQLVRFDGTPPGPHPHSLNAVDAACTLLQQGEIIAIKGIGGFHLACDASNHATVARLRARKQRYTKPFALMARDIDVIRRYAEVSAVEEKLLSSAEAPIVLLSKHRRETGWRTGEKDEAAAVDTDAIPPAVAPGTYQLGFMLPYTPLHHLLIKRMHRPIVLTSGNLADEPQCVSNQAARVHLAPMTDFVLWHDRDIVNRVDDSVACVVAGRPRLMRRARGYAPAPMPLPPGFGESTDLLAMGGELKNTFCLVKDNQTILSQHIGDLEDARTLKDYRHNLGLYRRLFDHHPQAIVIDKHPEYLSGKTGRKVLRHTAGKLIEVQHHHAHLAACLADNRWPLSGGRVLGVILDGLGYGDHGELWGGEFLLADYAGYQRLATFKPVALLGGAQAMREPWRNTYAHLMAEIGWHRLKRDFNRLELVQFLETRSLHSFNQMLKQGLNSPLASSCGRLFDAVAAAIGLCRESVGYEGEAAIRLEASVDQHALKNEDEALAYPFSLACLHTGTLPYIEPLAMWQAVLKDLALGLPAGVMAARFHRGLAKGIVAAIEHLTTKDKVRMVSTVALSGGVFQNRILLEQVHEHLTRLDYQVLSHARVPANDGCLALGQAVVGLAQTA